MNLKPILFGGNGTGTILGDAALAVMRLGIGLMMAFGHGMSKVFQPGHFGPPEQFVQGVAKMGFPAPTLFAWLSALAEFLGGLLIAMGLLTRPAAAVLAFNMCVAAFVTLLHAPFVSSTFFPERPWAVNYFEGLADGSTSTTLMVTPAQYMSDAPGSSTMVLFMLPVIALTLGMAGVHTLLYTSKGRSVFTVLVVLASLCLVGSVIGSAVSHARAEATASYRVAPRRAG